MKYTIKILACLVLFFGISTVVSAQKKFDLLSPDGSIKVSVNLEDKIYYTLSASGQQLAAKNHLALSLTDEVLGRNPKLSNSKTGKNSEIIKPVVPVKFAEVKSEYNYLLLNFKGNYSVEFRAFNDGIAYRFITAKKGNIEVLNEDFTLNLPSDYLLHLQQPDGFKTSSEDAYTHVESQKWSVSDKMSTLPVLIDTRKQYKILISESGLIDYPGMFLKGTGSGVTSTFPKVPLQFGPDGDRSLKNSERSRLYCKDQWHA